MICKNGDGLQNYNIVQGIHIVLTDIAGSGMLFSRSVGRCCLGRVTEVVVKQNATRLDTHDQNKWHNRPVQRKAIPRKPKMGL